MVLDGHEQTVRIDVYDKLGTWGSPGSAKLGVIPIVENMKRTRSLNQIGGLEFVIPAQSIKSMALLVAGNRYHVYHKTYGDLGIFIHRNYTLSADKSEIVVTCDDLLKLWARRTTKLSRVYGLAGTGVSGTTVQDALNDLIDWMYAHDPSYTPPEQWTLQLYDPTNTLATQTISVDFEGQTMFEAVDALRKLTQSAFRLSIVNNQPRLEFGNFFTGSLSLYGTATYGTSVYFGTLTAAAGKLYAQNSEQLGVDNDSGGAPTVVMDVQIIQETDKIVNRVIPLGAGNALNQFTMKASYDFWGAGSKPAASTYSYTLQRAQNPGFDAVKNPSYFYYLEDAASIAQYGLFEDVVASSSIRPLTNSAKSQQLAADALYYIGAAYLANNAQPSTTYKISVQNLPTGTNVGDVFYFKYVGIASYTDDFGTMKYKYIDVNSAAVIMDIVDTFQSDGTLNQDVTISTNGQRGVTETDVVIGTQQSVNALKVSVQPYPCRDTVYASEELAPGYDVVFQVPIGNEVLAVLSAIMTFQAVPLRTVINPDVGASMQQLVIPPTTSFTYFGPNEQMPDFTDTDNGLKSTRRYTDDYRTELSTSPDYKYNRADHSHTIPFVIGMNLDYDYQWPKYEMRGVSNQVYDQLPALFVTYAGSIGGDADFAFGHFGSPSGMANQYYILGARVDRPNSLKHNTSTTNDADHIHTFHVPHHYHTIGTLGPQNIRLNFGIFDDNLIGGNYPTGVSILVNNQAVFAGLNPAQTFITIDISNFINLNTINEVRFQCTGGRGKIKAAVRLFMSVQATTSTIGL